MSVATIRYNAACSVCATERQMQFSLRQLFYVTASIGIACAALVYASPLWASLAFSLSIILLLASIVLMHATMGRQRAFWVGFAVCGWGYFAVLHSPLLSLQIHPDPWHAQSGGPPLLASMILDWAYVNVLSLVHPQPQVDPTGMAIRSSSGYPLSPDFYRVGHSLFALLSAMGGGMLGSAAFARFRKSESAGPPTGVVRQV
jgi:hypothetical protein